jgi:tetratricopeptide (TPR) repeat protein
LTGDHAYLSGNYRLSLRYLDSALNQTSPTYRWAERGSIYADMADVYLDIKSYEKAYVVADSNLYYVQKSGNPFEIANALELLYSCAKLSGEYERALSLYQDLSVLRDSIEKIEKANDLSRLEEKYYRVRREKSEAEYNQDQKLLKQQVEIGILKKRLILVGSIVLALLLAYVYMVFRQKNLKTKQKELEAQNRVNRSKFNADLIYQALNKIQEGDQVDSASYKKKVNSFSKLLKRALDSNFNDFMTIEKEIEFLSLYLNFLKENTKTDFTYLFEVDSNLDVRNCCVPALLLQPFIESIVRKGFKDLGKTGTITIYFQIRNLTELRIVIEDNGRGLKSIDSIRATEIINDRLFLLNKLNKTNASFFIRERVSGGVSVEVYLPIITKAFAEGLTLED